MELSPEYEGTLESSIEVRYHELYNNVYAKEPYHSLAISNLEGAALMRDIAEIRLLDAIRNHRDG